MTLQVDAAASHGFYLAIMKVCRRNRVGWDRSDTVARQSVQAFWGWTDEYMEKVQFEWLRQALNRMAWSDIDETAAR